MLRDFLLIAFRRIDTFLPTHIFYPRAQKLSPFPHLCRAAQSSFTSPSGTPSNKFLMRCSTLFMHLTVNSFAPDSFPTLEAYMPVAFSAEVITFLLKFTRLTAPLSLLVSLSFLLAAEFREMFLPLQTIEDWLRRDLVRAWRVLAAAASSSLSFFVASLADKTCEF